ncbi:MAG: cyclic nucleotide-binding domain-containing protein [Pyrinomonadaceae bacterium]
MPREIKKHERIIDAFRDVAIVSELVEQLPNGEFKNELDMDITLFGRTYRGHQVGPYVRLLEFSMGETLVQEGTWESGIFFILVKGKLDAFRTETTGRRKIGEIHEGNSFGEMALLAGMPRTATVVVASDSGTALVLELSRPAIRLLRKLPTFGKTLDRNYRAYGLSLTLNELKDFPDADFDRDLMERLDNAARFAVYEKGHVLFREGDPVNRVVFIRHGWVQRVHGADFNPKAADLLIETEDSIGVDFVGAGSCLGLDSVSAAAPWQFTATARSRTEVMEIAISRLREEESLSRQIIPVLKHSSRLDDKPVPQRPVDIRVLNATTKEIETGIIDAVNLLVMDMQKCIRCGNCSLACHKVHGNSRLVRRGIHIERPVKPLKKTTQSVLVPTVCMHCQDPECLTGCPTGAIARFPDGEIDIDPGTCIGCGDCATQCPYNAISMIPMDKEAKIPLAKRAAARLLSVFSLSSTALPAPVTQTESLLAVKCNLCKDTGMNPPGSKREAYSCEENCPTGALVRVNPREYFDEAGNALGLVQRSKTHAIGVNIHKFDLWATIWHIFGVLMILIGGTAAAFATYRFTQDAPLYSMDTWVTMRWLTGLSGLAGIVWVMGYPLRKQIYRRRAGALRYWMLSHIYIGVLAGIVLLVHGGRSSGGLITSVLMISFDLVVASGIFGAACYLIVPRFMTRIEREPLLLEDLQARRKELRTELITAGGRPADAGLNRLIRTKIRRRFLGPGYLLRQYLRREDLNTMLASARAEFRFATDGLTRLDAARLMEAVETAATLRRIDALIYLHRLLKIWLAPHVLFTSIMLVLLVVHIIQVIYFNVR